VAAEATLHHESTQLNLIGGKIKDQRPYQACPSKIDLLLHATIRDFFLVLIQMGRGKRTGVSSGLAQVGKRDSASSI
jgi:hypothetical protein